MGINEKCMHGSVDICQNSVSFFSFLFFFLRRRLSHCPDRSLFYSLKAMVAVLLPHDVSVIKMIKFFFLTAERK